MSVPESWRPVDLGPIWYGIETGNLEIPTPTVARRADGPGLFYPGRVNWLFGRYASAKSWVVDVATVQEITEGQTVWRFDFEDDAVGAVERMIDLGADRDKALEHLRYVNPVEALDPRNTAAVIEAVAESSASLVVADSAGEWMALQGVKSNHDEEVANFVSRFLRPLARIGPAVVGLDHVAHDQSDPLRAIGSQRKMSMISGAAHHVEMTREMGRGKTGTARITCAKDRRGHYPRGSVVAELNIDAAANPYQWDLAPVEDPTSGPLADESPSVRRTWDALNRTEPPARVRQLGDLIAEDGTKRRDGSPMPLKERTIQDALGRLRDLDLACIVGGEKATGYEWAPVPHAHPEEGNTP